MRLESVYCAGSTPAIRYAAESLEQNDVTMIHDDSQLPGAVLLDVPSFRPDGALRGGGSLEMLLQLIPGDVPIIGGNLDHPLLEGRKKLDLLKDEEYLAKNAAITAYCTLPIAMEALTVTPDQAPTLIIGWGRIGKCLAKLLRGMGANVTVSARKPADLALLRALGYSAFPLHQIDLTGYRLIINTVPVLLLDEKALSRCPGTVKIDLASRQGMKGKDVIRARGLPGIHAPESSGRLIAETIIRLSKEELT